MDEFNNRIEAQRAVLKTINNSSQFKEELFSLSQKAIKRWIAANKLDINSDIVKIVEEIADKLFFLANKSQQQVTEDYKTKSKEIFNLNSKLREKVKAQMFG